MNYSNRILEIAGNPKFKIEKTQLESHLSDFSQNHLAYVYEVPNSNGEINLIGKIENDSPRKFEFLNYETNITGPALGYLDAMIFLLLKREWPGMASTLTVKEVESFLRDKNEVPAFSKDEVFHFRIHDLINGLEKYLHERFNLNSRRSSPSFNLNKNEEPFYPKNELGAFFTVLPESERYYYAEEILDEYIREFLKKDGGDVEISTIWEGIISINYKGSCNECGSSLGSTLDFIQKTFRFHLQEPNLMVVTDS